MKTDINNSDMEPNLNDKILSDLLSKMERPHLSADSKSRIVSRSVAMAARRRRLVIIRSIALFLLIVGVAIASVTLVFGKLGIPAGLDSFWNSIGQTIGGAFDAIMAQPTGRMLVVSIPMLTVWLIVGDSLSRRSRKARSR